MNKGSILGICSFSGLPAPCSLLLFSFFWPRSGPGPNCSIVYGCQQRPPSGVAAKWETSNNHLPADKVPGIPGPPVSPEFPLPFFVSLIGEDRSQLSSEKKRRETWSWRRRPSWFNKLINNCWRWPQGGFRGDIGGLQRGFRGIPLVFYPPKGVWGGVTLRNG